MKLRWRWLRVTWGRTVVLLSLALAGLQVFHMVLLNQLEVRNTTKKRLESVRILQQDAEIFHPIILDSVQSSHVMDSSGEYRIIYNVMKSRESPAADDAISKKYGVTLVTQCSLNHLHHLVHLSREWAGPISVAVFVPEQYSAVVVASLLVLHYCIPHITSNISIHLVYPLTPSPLDVSRTPAIPHVSDCVDFHKVLDLVLERQLKPLQNYDLGVEKYPNNLLRNVATRYVATDHLMVLDVDIVPSPNLFQDFAEFARRVSFTSETAALDAQTVYVLPVFEIQRNVDLPRDKASLTRLWDLGQVRPFYNELCWKCQKHTDYTQWRNLTGSSLGLGAQYEVEWKDPWEPFFIAPRNTIPGYDERFKQFGFNRISQVCETHVAGLKFAVLDEAFLLHLGYKTQEGFHHNKDLEQEQNRLLFRKFKEELKTKYPESPRRCY